MGFVILHIARREKFELGFVHLVFELTPPWSIWSEENKKYWSLVLLEKRSHKEIWRTFMIHALIEGNSNSRAKHFDR